MEVLPVCQTRFRQRPRKLTHIRFHINKTKQNFFLVQLAHLLLSGDIETYACFTSEKVLSYRLLIALNVTLITVHFHLLQE